ncbi:MAG: hypothetical protein HQM11_02295 [SAR324 cluster bacterium]|nr:hypothetical protein [SAR324 cluster bacterium]
MISGYQLESLLNAYRRVSGVSVQETPGDPLNISEEAREQLLNRIRQDKVPQLTEWVTPKNILAFIQDNTVAAAEVEYELQRRAGLFLNPPFIPPNPLLAIKLVKAPGTKGNTAEEISASHTLPASAQISVEPEQPKVVQPLFTQTLVEPEQMEDELQQIVEEPEEELFETDRGTMSDDDTSVVYGTGPIADKAIIDFIEQYPDSALKFVFRKDLDEKTVKAEMLKMYESWQKRGMTKGKVIAGIKMLMEWDEIPAQPIADLYSSMQSRIYDIKHGLVHEMNEVEEEG